MGAKEKGPNTQTKMRVVMALQELMSSKPLEKIKVSELCVAAGISRTTFYEHFCDLYQVPTWLWDHLLSSSLYEMGVSTTCYQGHLDKFTTLLEYRDFFRLAFRSSDYNSVFEHGQREVKEAILTTASKNAGRCFTEQELLEIEFYNAGAAYMTKLWAEGGMKESPETMTQLFQSFTPSFLIDYLEPLTTS